MSLHVLRSTERGKKYHVVGGRCAVALRHPSPPVPIDAVAHDELCLTCCYPRECQDWGPTFSDDAVTKPARAALTALLELSAAVRASDLPEALADDAVEIREALVRALWLRAPGRLKAQVPASSQGQPLEAVSPRGDTRPVAVTEPEPARIPTRQAITDPSQIRVTPRRRQASRAICSA